MEHNFQIKEFNPPQ